MPKPTTKASDLIAIANPELAERLASEQAEQSDSDSGQSHTAHAQFNADLWKTLIVLNYLRYAFAIACLFMLFAENQFKAFSFFGQLEHRNIIYAAIVIFPFSAILIAYLSKTRRLPLKPIMAAQFSLDLLQTILFIHVTDNQSSFFLVIYFLIVATGSIILSRREALGLASAAIILMFLERGYSCLESECFAAPFSRVANSSEIGLFAILLMLVAYGISHLASNIRRQNKISSYKLGDESIESYLIKQEKEALKSALKASNGNKTEAAKLVGMTFRSFRYKLSKYEIS